MVKEIRHMAIIRYVLRLCRPFLVSVHFHGCVKNSDPRGLFETESTPGLERCDGGRFVSIGFDEHVKSAEGEGGLGILGEVE